jgi:hypothetical protein
LNRRFAINPPIKKESSGIIPTLVCRRHWSMRQVRKYQGDVRGTSENRTSLWLFSSAIQEHPNPTPLAETNYKDSTLFEGRKPLFQVSIERPVQLSSILATIGRQKNTNPHS